MPLAALYRAIPLVNPLQWSIFLSAAEAIGP